MIKMMVQEAPWPAPLADLVDRLYYRPNWRFWLDDMDRGQGSTGLTLVIQIAVEDTYPPHHLISVRHLMPVPPAAFDERSWQRWLFEQILLVERHEAAEYFRLAPTGDLTGATEDQLVRPYAPSHGPGNDPYLVRELGTEIDQRTDFRGKLDGHWRIVCGLGILHGAGGFLTRAGAWGYLNEMPSCAGSHAVEFVPRDETVARDM